MSDIGSTGKYVAIITLSTAAGDLPSKEDTENLVFDQMQGELDDISGLQCIAVEILSEPIGELG